MMVQDCIGRESVWEKRRGPSRNIHFKWQIEGKNFAKEPSVFLGVKERSQTSVELQNTRGGTFKKERPENSDAKNSSKNMTPSALPVTLTSVGSWSGEDSRQMAVD